MAKRTGAAAGPSIGTKAAGETADPCASPLRPVCLKLLDQFRSYLVIVLLLAAVLASAIGDLKDAVVILVVVLTAALCFDQEHRAERTLAALRGMLAPRARPVRGDVGTVAGARGHAARMGAYSTRPRMPTPRAPSRRSYAGGQTTTRCRTGGQRDHADQGPRVPR
ncbi:MAG: hypothetical protein MUC77_05865 [Chromatiaceae bacterium]|nr:hypothetical protein [Chromatiaceae bacterium]